MKKLIALLLTVLMTTSAWAYSEIELEILKRRQLPARVESVISLLELYNQELIENKINTDNIIKPFNSKILAQFVTIKKIPVGQKEQNDLKTNLDILTNYIYRAVFFFTRGRRVKK